MHSPAIRRLLLAALLGAAGCARKEPGDVTTVSDKPVVRVVAPERRTIVRRVGQPSFVEAWEQTSIYPKMSAYLEKWNVDIGDPIKKGEILGTLFVPELIEEQRLKQAQHDLDQELVKQADKLVLVSAGKQKAAVSMVKESQATVGKYQAGVDRWRSEVKRLEGVAADGAVDNQVLLESRRQLKSNSADLLASQASVETATANQIAADADLEKARQDVKVAQARVAVSKADVARAGALVGYLKLTAPYDGVVISRNANTGDFVLPASGDPSASRRSEDQSTSRAAPIYVLARTDKVRVYIDAPESDAVYVHSEVGRATGRTKEAPTPAVVRVKAVRDREFTGTVARAAWALTSRSRTLRAEVDLPNPDGLLRPGMYAIGELVLERKNVFTVPARTVVEIGEDLICYRLLDGKAVKTRVRAGVSDGSFLELEQWRDKDGKWVPFKGDEQILDGDMSELGDGVEVRMAK